MNKKVDEEFKGIKDVYVLQCICTELKELCNKYEEEHSNEFKIWKEERHELLDYKSRCEKTIEYNNRIIKDTKDFYRPTTDIIYSGDALIEIATNNINILQNGGEKNEYNK